MFERSENSFYIVFKRRGEMAFTIPKNLEFSEKQISFIVDLVEDMFNDGYKSGEMGMKYKIRQVLGLI